MYREAALSVRKRRRCKGVMVDRQARQVPAGPNEIWSIDFVMDALANGRRTKCLTIVGDFTPVNAWIPLSTMASQVAT